MTATKESHLDVLVRLGGAGPECTEGDVAQMYPAAKGYFRDLLSDAPPQQIAALLTKYNDAGP